MLEIGSEVTVKIVTFPFMISMKGVIVDTSNDGKYGWLQSSDDSELYWVGETQVVKE